MNLIQTKGKVFVVLAASILVSSFLFTASLPLLADDEAESPDGGDLVFRAFLPVIAQVATFAAAEAEVSDQVGAPLVEEGFVEMILTEEEDGDNFAGETLLALAQADEVQAAESAVLRYDDLPDVGEFVVDGRKWNRLALTYYFKNGTNDIAGSGEKTAIRQAFALWSAVVLRNGQRLTFTEVSSASRADIVILFGTRSHGDPYPFDGTNGVLAHAFYPPPNGGSIAGDAHFDDSERWTKSTRPNGTQPIDLVTVAAHEIGHSLGLGHSSSSGALMYPYYTGSHRFLSSDDINGIRYIYP